jgi:branched-chain amino acid transport system permease protein
MADNLKSVFLKIKSNKNTLNITLITVIFVVMYGAMTLGFINRYNSTIFILVLVSIIMATSLNIATGFLGQLVLGHAGFMAIGAYVAALLGILLRDVIQFSFLSDGLNNLLLFIISALGAGVFAAIAGIIVGFPALRLRGDYLGIMTLGFGEIIRAIITNLEITNGAQGLSGIPRIMNFPIAFWSTVLIVVFVYLFMNSRHGRAILSIREDEIASESVGTDITKYKLIGFILASGFGGIGGAIYAFQIGYLAPSAFGFVKSVDIFVIVVLGGMGSISGGIIAAIFLTFLPEYLREFNQYRLLLYSMLLIFTMLFRPKGLMGTKEFSAKEFITKIIKLVPQLPRLFVEFIKKTVASLKQIPKYVVQVVKNFVNWIKTKLSRKDRD